MGMSAGRPRIMLLISPSSYRGEAFSRAARRLEVEAVPVLDLPEDLEKRLQGQHSIDFKDIPSSVEWIRRFNIDNPLAAILSVDDSATELAAVASDTLGLPSNDPEGSPGSPGQIRCVRC
ncbi:MAG: hypothetical protein R3A46_14930 [Thermomicrobiales bacterium]